MGSNTSQGLQLVRPASEDINRGKERSRKNTTYTFPSDLGRHCMVINFATYNYNSGGGITGVDHDSIVLPLPKQLAETSSLQVDGKELGVVGAGAIDVIGNKIDFGDLGASAAESVMDKIKSLFGAGAGTTADIQGLATDVVSTTQFLTRAGLGSISPEIGSAIEAEQGRAINPHTTLMFDGVNLKTHTFNWELAPQSEKDSQILRDMNRFIKRKIHPTYANPLGESRQDTSFSRGLLTYPSVAKIFFLGVNQDYFFSLKPCMIREFSIDYTPNGQSILKGGKPAFINIQMTAVEQTIHTSEDYEDSRETAKEG